MKLAVNRLGTIGESGSETDEDLAQRLADSFGGAVEDRFIQARLKKLDVHVPTLLDSLWKQPRRGFDALVDALLPTIKATEKTDAKREIARAIGADENDRVVANLAARILFHRTRHGV